MAKVLYRVGRFCARRRGLVMLVWVLVAVGVGLLVSRVGAETNDNLSLPGTGSQAATDLLASRFPPRQNGSSPIVFYTPSGQVTDAANKQAIEDSYDAIVKVPHVYSATDPFAQGASSLISQDGKAAYIPVLMDLSSSELTEEEAQAVLDAAQPGREAGMQVAAGGPIGSELSEPKTESSEVIGIAAAMVILTFAFGTIVAMGMPILVAIVGLAVGLGAIGLLGHVAQVPSIAPTLATMIGLGVGIDYALFLVMRHLHQVRGGMDVRESIARAVATSGTGIVFAGTTVVIALVALAVAGIPLVTALGYSSAVAVFTAVLGAVTLMPAVLSLVGRRIESLRLPRFLHPAPKPPGRGFWAAWARFVTGHPWLAVLLGAAILTPLIVPVFSLRLGQEDIGATPKSTTERQAYDLMSAEFGPGYNGPFLIATQLDPVATTDPIVAENMADGDALKNELEQEQAQGQAQQQALEQEADELQSEQAQLEDEQARLEGEQAQLEREQARLEAQAASLETQRPQLERDAAALRVEEARLRGQEERLRAEERRIRAREAAIRVRARALFRQAERLVRQGRELRAELTAIQAQEADVEEQLDAATDPEEIDELQTQLAELEGQEAAVSDELVAVRARGKVLADRARGLLADARAGRGQADALRSQARSVEAEAIRLAGQAAELDRRRRALEAEAAELAREGNALREQGDALQAQADALRQQGADLQAQAADLENQKAQLEALQQQAQVQQQEAQELQDTLTTQLTKAGGDERGTDPRLVALQDALTATAGVALLSPPLINDKGDATIFSLIPTTAPSDEATADLVVTLRDSVIPTALSGSQGIEAFVGGSTAANVDLAAEIQGKLVLVILVVLLLSVLVLLLAFRSLLVPLQAAAVNLGCAAAAFGVLVACFQWGWGVGLVGIETDSDAVPIASYVPLMMFAVLFGLSMDYQVFLLSQIDQHRAAGESDIDGARSGLAFSAKVIAAAALIMICVFGSFILNGDPIVKQFGVGLAVAVALAASMVLLLTPALLVLGRRAAWWLPRWLGAILPRMDIEGANLREELEPSAETVRAATASGPAPPGSTRTGGS